MTASETIKKCGLKSTKQVADLNGRTPRTIQIAYKSDRARFNSYVLKALHEQFKAAHNNAVKLLEVERHERQRRESIRDHRNEEAATGNI